jgi:hypothetical protein
MKLAGAIAALALVSTTLVAVTPADAQWRGRYHRHGGWWGPGVGFAAGALIGGALAARPYYGPNYYYGPGPGPYAYDVEPEVEVDGGSVAYCQQRYKSYDPASGTFLGYDGLRHPCP